MEVQTAPISVPLPPERPALPAPAPVNLLPVDWTVVTSDSLPPGDSWVIIGLSPDQYEALSLNMAELLRWAEEAGYQIRYYRGETG